MTILIMSAWAVGILLLIAVAVYRGRASTARASEATPSDESEPRTHTKKSFYDTNSRVSAELLALAAEMHELRVRPYAPDNEHLDILIFPSELQANKVLMDTLRNDRTGPRTTKKAVTQVGI